MNNQENTPKLSDEEFREQLEQAWKIQQEISDSKVMTLYVGPETYDKLNDDINKTEVNGARLVKQSYLNLLLSGKRHCDIPQKDYYTWVNVDTLIKLEEKYYSLLCSNNFTS